MQYRRAGNKRSGNFPQQNAKRARYSRGYMQDPPNLLVQGASSRRRSRESSTGGYRTTTFNDLPPRPRKRPPPQRSTQRLPSKRPPPERPPRNRLPPQRPRSNMPPPQRAPPKRQPPQRPPPKRKPPQRPPPKRKPPQRPPVKKPVKKAPVHVPLFPQKSESESAGIPAQINVSPSKKARAKQLNSAKRSIPKQAPKKKMIPKPVPKKKAAFQAKGKVVGKKKPVSLANPVANKKKQAKPKPKPAPKRIAKPKSVPSKKKPPAPTSPTKAMKPTLDLDSEMKLVVEKDKERGDDDLGWNIHPELRAAVNVTGKWRSKDQSGAGAFHFMQECGKLSGHIDAQTPCEISGEIDTDKRTFNFVQKFSKLKKVTAVEVTGTVELTVMKTSFTYEDPDGGSPKRGNATIVQEPTGSMTGVWAPLEMSVNFHIFHYPGGLVLGYLDKPNFCQVFGTLKGNKLRIQQEWIGKGSKVQCVGEVVGEDYLILVYGYFNAEGGYETGTTKFHRKKGKLPDPPKVWKVSLVVDSNVQEEMKFTPQTALIKKVYRPPDKSSRVFIDKGVTEVVDNAEFCMKAGDITWHRERFTKQILTRPVPYGVKLTKTDNGSSHFPLYYPDMKILVLGEADFSFTIGLALKLQQHAGEQPLPTLVGTSYLEKADVPRNIFPPNFQDGPLMRTFINENSDVNNNLLMITDLGAHVRFGVDARHIHETLRQGENAFCSPHALPRKFDRIIFPFPRASLKRTNWNEENALLRGLFLSSKRELTTAGEIHLILHTSKLGINQFDMWGIREIAEENGYVWRASLPFNFRLLPPYYPKDVASSKWTPFEASIHVFTLKNTSWKVEKRLWRRHGLAEKNLIKNMKVCPPAKEYGKSKFVPDKL